MKKRFKIEYKDSISMRCEQVVHAEDEKRAIINFQLGLMSQDDYMTELISIDEVDNNYEEISNEWKLDDGTILDKEYQDALNSAFGSYVNEDGLTLEQAMERASQRKNNK